MFEVLESTTGTVEVVTDVPAIAEAIRKENPRVITWLTRTNNLNDADSIARGLFLNFPEYNWQVWKAAPGQWAVRIWNN